MISANSMIFADSDFLEAESIASRDQHFAISRNCLRLRDYEILEKSRPLYAIDAYFISLEIRDCVPYVVDNRVALSVTCNQQLYVTLRSLSGMASEKSGSQSCFNVPIVHA